jgi:phosphoribosylaminoimidazole (AIR) synthetase
LIARREHQAAQAILNSPQHIHDPDATYRQYQEKYGLPDLAHLTGDALMEDIERLVAAMPSEKRTAMEREGLL